MALEPGLWGTLPKELLHLVFARLPVAGIGQLRVLSKEWKWNIDCKDSEFSRVFDATTHLKMFDLLYRSWAARDEFLVDLYDMQADKWYVFTNKMEYVPLFKPSAADGRLFCSPWPCSNPEGHFQFVVENPLTQRKMKLPPLISMGAGKLEFRVKMVKFTIDRNTEEYKLHVVSYKGRTGDKGLFAQVYDSHINGWSVVESREGRIIGWEYYDQSLGPCVYNCADGNLQHFNPSDIAPGLTVERHCIELMNDHLFVLHNEAPPGSTNLMQVGKSISGKYCISEFHLPEKATAWVKLGVHECHPSICDSSWEELRPRLSLLACNGFLLVHSWENEPEYDRVWLYNLSTRAWRKLPDCELPHFRLFVLCEISWSALP